MRSFQILFIALIMFSGCYMPLNLNQVLVSEDPYKGTRTISLRQQEKAFADRSLRGRRLGYPRNVMLHFYTEKTGDVTATEIQLTIGTNVLERVQDEVFFDIDGNIFRKEIKELREEVYRVDEIVDDECDATDETISYNTKESLYKVEIDSEIRSAILKGKEDVSMRFYLEDVPYNVFLGVLDLKRVQAFLTME